jgi:hypothetical protein
MDDKKAKGKGSTIIAEVKFGEKKEKYKSLNLMKKHCWLSLMKRKHNETILARKRNRYCIICN